MSSMPESIKKEAAIGAPAMPRLRHVVRSSISDNIVEQLLALISAGELKPGQRLPSERDLCQRFGAGRSSLREALRCLCIVGVLKARVGEGTSVALEGNSFFSRLVEWHVVTEQQDIREMMELRIALEGITAANAARHATAEDVFLLNQLVTKMGSALERAESFAALDLDFHLVIATASKNQLILKLVTMIRIQLERSITRVLELPQARPLSVQEHRRILHAIETKDTQEAHEAMRAHLISAIARFEEVSSEPEEHASPGRSGIEHTSAQRVALSSKADRSKRQKG